MEPAELQKNLRISKALPDKFSPRANWYRALLRYYYPKYFGARPNSFQRGNETLGVQHPHFHNV